MLGGPGLDTAVYLSGRANYTIILDNEGFPARVNTLGETDTLAGIERLRFTDKILAYDIGGVAGQAYRLYQAAFDRTPDQPGLSFWVRVLDAKALNLEQVAGEFLRSAEFNSLYGNASTNADLVGLLYRNVLNREADVGGRDYWIGQLNNGMTREQLLINFSESAENQLNVVGVIREGITLNLG